MRTAVCVAGTFALGPVAGRRSGVWRGAAGGGAADFGERDGAVERDYRSRSHRSGFRWAVTWRDLLTLLNVGLALVRRIVRAGISKVVSPGG